MSSSVGEHLQLTKQQLFDCAGAGRISQTGGEVIDADFALPSIDRALLPSLPSIETFVVSTIGSLTTTGTNDAVTDAWLPTIERLVGSVGAWMQANGVEPTGDGYVTASVTAASEVNGEAHFDDDQFVPDAGTGFVAIVGDIAGPRVAAEPIPHVEIQAPRPVVTDEVLINSFAEGSIASTTYGPNELVVMPQFGQLHAGPGPSGKPDDVRHLLVYRVATVPHRSTLGSDPRVDQ